MMPIDTQGRTIRVESHTHEVIEADVLEDSAVLRYVCCAQSRNHSLNSLVHVLQPRDIDSRIIS